MQPLTSFIRHRLQLERHEDAVRIGLVVGKRCAMFKAEALIEAPGRAKGLHRPCLQAQALVATAASLFMAAALVLASHAGLSPLAQATGLARWAALGALIGIGGLVYAVAGAAFGAVRPRALLALLRRPRH